ncbi:MAG TPA: 50S ribosomal protein L20 [Candidatus Azoamicus sp. OHIO2]
MTRVKRGVVARKRHKKILNQAKGYYGAKSRVFRVAKQAVIKAQQYSYRDRKVKKRDFRSTWIKIINAALKQYNMSYSSFIKKLTIHEIKINRKMLYFLITTTEFSINKLIQNTTI